MLFCTRKFSYCEGQHCLRLSWGASLRMTLGTIPPLLRFTWSWAVKKQKMKVFNLIWIVIHIASVRSVSKSEITILISPKHVNYLNSVYNMFSYNSYLRKAYVSLESCLIRHMPWYPGHTAFPSIVPHLSKMAANLTACGRLRAWHRTGLIARLCGWLHSCCDVCTIGCEFDCELSWEKGNELDSKKASSLAC